MSKPVKIWIAVLLILALPLSLLLAAAALPDFYGETYYAELPALYQRLYETEGKKLILIGGSSVAFGVDTGLLEGILAEYGFDYTVCPFGLYAAVGTSVMLELAEDKLHCTVEGVVDRISDEPLTSLTFVEKLSFWEEPRERRTFTVDLTK